jgi:hypothetical protein
MSVRCSYKGTSYGTIHAKGIKKFNRLRKVEIVNEVEEV